MLALFPSWLGLLGDWHWTLDLLAHFRWQYLLVSVIAVTLAAWRRLRVVATLALLTLALNMFLIVQLAWQPEVDDARLADDFSLRVLSMNVRTSNLHTDAALDYAMASDADVVVVIEVNHRWLAALERLESKYPYRIVEPRADNFGIALFSRLPWETADVLRFGDAGLPSIEVAMRHQGRRFAIIGTHPLPPVGRGAAALRDAQLDDLAAHVARLQHPALVVGDLNTTPWSAGMRKLASRNLAFGTSDAPWTPTWRARSLVAIPIDHALASPPLVITGRSVGIDVGSDHRPLAVSLGWSR